MKTKYNFYNILMMNYLKYTTTIIHDFNHLKKSSKLLKNSNFKSCFSEILNYLTLKNP